MRTKTSVASRMARLTRSILSFLILISAMFAWIVPSARSHMAANPAEVAELKMTLRGLYVNYIFILDAYVRQVVLPATYARKINVVGYT